MRVKISRSKPLKLSWSSKPVMPSHGWFARSERDFLMAALTRYQCSFKPKYRLAHPAIYSFLYLKESILNQSIQKTIYLILKSEALPGPMILFSSSSKTASGILATSIFCSILADVLATYHDNCLVLFILFFCLHTIRICSV